MDIGVNKALYDFLPIMMYFCRNRIHLATLSLERDCLNLDKRPELLYSRYGNRKDNAIVMTRRPRSTYFLHFGSLGFQYDDKKNTTDEYTFEIGKNAKCSNNTVVIAIKEDASNQLSSKETDAAINQAKNEIIKQAESQGIDQFFQNWTDVDLNDDISLNNIGKKLQNFIRETRLQQELPLKWIILRSLVVSLNKNGKPPMIFYRGTIVEVAKGLEMNEEEVDEFLKTFTDFGSILYIPEFDAIKDLVIVDIWQFTQFLDQLFYPDSTLDKIYGNLLTKYGFLLKSLSEQILGKNEEEFMQLITTFAIAAKIDIPVICSNGEPLFPYEEYYYLPSARVQPPQNTSTEIVDFSFLEITSINFPANIQACISHGITANNPNVFMVATEESNISRFEFRPNKKDPPIRIEMIYEGTRTKLRVMNSTNDIMSSPNTIKACSQILIGCCRCLRRKTNRIRKLRYDVGIPCCVGDGNYHFIYSDDTNETSDVCDACKAETPDNQFRLCWIKAIRRVNDKQESGTEQLNLLKRGSSHRLNQDDLAITMDDIYSVASQLAEANLDPKTLSEILNVSGFENKEENPEMALCQTMAMLCKWKNAAGNKAFKNTLAQLLKKNYSFRHFQIIKS